MSKIYFLKGENMIYSSILDLVGNTPLLRLRSLTTGCVAEVVVKLENLNPCFSIKDRIGLGLIADAEEKKLISSGATIIEPTSGNTGIGLALACTLKGYKLILVMPENMSKERQMLLQGFGVQIVLTPAEEGMGGSVKKAKELHAQMPGSFLPDQFSNPVNPVIHMRSTAEEIWKDTNGEVDFFVSGVGSGGTLAGNGAGLKAKNPKLQLIAVEPENSAVLSGKKAGQHQIQGIGAGFIPTTLDMKMIDQIITVSNENAVLTAQKLLLKEGILCGISSGANVWAALQLAQKQENAGKRIVTIICDTGERYLSTPLFQNNGAGK